MKTELEEYRSTNEESKNAKATAESTKESYEIVMNIYQHFTASDMSDNAMLDELLKVKPDALGTEGQDRYKKITDTLYPRMCQKLLDSARDSFKVANYKTAIENLEKVSKMDAGYGDGRQCFFLPSHTKKRESRIKPISSIRN